MRKRRTEDLALLGLVLAATINCASGASAFPRPNTGIAVAVPASAKPGSNTTITVIAARDLDLQQVAIAMTSESNYMIRGHRFFKVNGNGPWEFSFPIPEEALGDVTIFATGKRRGEKASDLVSESVTLPIDLGTARLTELIFDNPAGWTVDPQPASPHVIGKFSDGVTRNVSSVKLGTTYASSDVKIAKFDEKGNLYCLAEGSTTLLASYGGMKAQIVLKVGRRP